MRTLFCIHAVRADLLRRASSFVPTRFESWRAPLVAPSIRHLSPSYTTPRPPLSRSRSSSTPPDASSPLWPPGPLSRRSGFVSTPRAFPLLLGHITLYPARQTTVWRSRSTLTPLSSLCTSRCPPGPIPRHGAFVPSTRSFLSSSGPSWTLWTPPGTTVSPSGSFGSSRGLPGELFRPVLSGRLLMRSDASCSLLGHFLTSSMCPDAPDVCASPFGLPRSSRPSSGESFGLLPFERSRSHSDVFCATLGQFRGSSLPSDTPDASISPAVGPVSQLATLFLPPLSSTLGDLFSGLAGPSGGSGGVGGIPGMSPSSVEGC